MENDKRRYYISVTHNLIQDVPNDSAEFEMMLTDEQVASLKDQMDALIKDDEYTFKRAFVPYKSADHDDATEEFDEKLIGLYAYLYEIGDEKTRQLIERMNILPKLHQTDYHDDGYDGSPLNK